MSLHSAVNLLLTQPQYYRIGCFLMLVKPTARTEKSTQILCVLSAECGCWSSQEHSRKELIAQHTQKSCALFLSCCLLDQHQKTLAGLVIALLVPRTAASTIKQVGQFGILLASTLCYNLFGSHSREEMCPCRVCDMWQYLHENRMKK